MKPWKDLSMKERGAFIRVGVKNGITSVDGIRDAYNKFACGGHKFDDGGPKLTPEEQYQEMVEAKMMSAPLLRFGDERGSWRWSRNLGAEAYMPEIEVVAENKSGKSTTKRGEQPTAIKNERLTEEEKKEEEKFWTNQRDAEPEMAVTRRPEGYWREQGLEAPILSTGRPADEPIDWQGTGYNHSPEYQKAMSQYRIANMTPEQRWAMTDDQMFKGEVLNAGMGIMMAPAFNPIASIGSGIMDLKYNKNKDWTNYVGDALAIGLPIAGTAVNAPTYYRNVQNLYNQGRRVYDMYKYLESLPTSYTGVPQSKVAQLEAVRAGKIPRIFNVWTSDNKLLGKHVYAKKNGMTNGKLYNVRDLNRNRYMLDTPRAKDYGEGVNVVSWYNLPYDVQTISNGPGLVDLPNSKIEIAYAPQNTIRERLTGKTRTYAASKHKNTTDLILYKASRIPNNQGVIFNDITDGTITSVFKLPFEKYHRVIHWDTPIIKERVYNPKASLLLTPDEPTWMSAWRYRNNQGLRNRMLMEKGYKPDKIFSPQELRKGIMNASYARGGKLFNKFQDGGTKLSNGEFNSILRRQAETNAKYWGVSPAEAYRHMLNDPTYDYRGFYEANPDAQNNPETHWPDTYKTYLHDTFSNESKYSGKIVFPYNPTGAVGGRWEGDKYIPNDEYHRRSWEEEKARMNQKAKGGRLAHKFDGGGDEESVNLELLSPLERVTTFDYGKEYIDEKGRHTGKSEGQQLVNRYNSYMKRYRNDMVDAYYIMTEEYGFNPETASGIIGNILQESDGNYKKEQNGGTGPGRGLFQWEQASKGGSGSWEKYEKWLNGKTDSAANQVRYMCSEYIKNQHTPFTAFKNDHPKLYKEHMETGKPDSNFISATNPDLRPYYAHVTDTQAKTMLYTGNPTESSLGFMQVVEKPKTPRAEYRAHFANQWYNDMLYNGDKLKEGYYKRNKKK